MTHLFSIPNLTSSQAAAFDPAKNKGITAPEKMTKAQFSDWCSNPNTTGTFVSAFEGLNPHIRVTEKGNQAHRMHGLIADYDTRINEDALREGLKERAAAGFLPAFFHNSYNSRGRVIWLFEKPLLLVPGITHAFLKILRKETGANNLFPGLDENILKPSQYFHWHPPVFEFSKDRVGTNTLSFLLGRAFDISKNYKGEGPLDIPLDRVAEAVQTKFPGRWQGEFNAGARGVCFWNPISDNPTAAVVTPTGMLAFSQDKPFYSWSDIFGFDFVREFEEDKYGAPLAAYYFDGKYYWHKNERKDWVATNKDDTRQDIMGDYSLSSAPNARGTLSEVDEALRRIRGVKKIDKAIPLLYSAEDVVFFEGEHALNISRVKVVPPYEELVAWGSGFPWLAGFLDNFLEEVESPTIPGIKPLQALMAWTHRFYTSALDNCLNQGHAIFIAGGVGRGKTLFSNVIMGGLMGGSSEATDFLLGNSSWNKDLLGKPIWTVDDATATTDYNKLALWSSMIKKSVANTRHPYNVKFHDPTIVEWKGRIICSLNDDPESIRQIPHSNISILDKIMLFHTSALQPDFPPNHVLEATIRSELPYFARWIKEFEIPTELQTGSRYGIKSYHHPVLLEDTRSMSRSHAFAELLEEFKLEYHAHHPEQKVWVGTATRLLQEMQNTESLRELVRHYTNTPEQMGRRLAAIMDGDIGIKKHPPHRGSTRWEISLNEAVETIDGW